MWPWARINRNVSYNATREPIPSQIPPLLLFNPDASRGPFLTTSTPLDLYETMGNKCYYDETLGEEATEYTDMHTTDPYNSLLNPDDDQDSEGDDQDSASHQDQNSDDDYYVDQNSYYSKGQDSYKDFDHEDSEDSNHDNQLDSDSDQHDNQEDFEEYENQEDSEEYENQEDSEDLEDSEEYENQEDSEDSEEYENHEDSEEYENQKDSEEYENQEDYSEEYENQEDFVEYENQEDSEEYENQEDSDEYENQDSAEEADKNSTIHAEEADKNSTIHAEEADTNSTIHAEEADTNSTIHAEEADTNSTIHVEEADKNSTIHAEEADKNSTIHDVMMKPNDSTNGGQYLLETCIGSGAFGAVYKATDQWIFPRESVAIKIVPLMQSQKEIDCLRTLKHWNIVSYKSSYSFLQHDGSDRVAIVMEYCSGGSLMNTLLLYSYKPHGIEFSKRVCWYKQLASATSYIHNQGIAHRDIKPENILLDGNGIIKVGDVGISKAVWDSYTQSQSTQSLQHFLTSVKGTRPYMAPEIYAKNNYGIPCDVFSLGLVFWMINALPPHHPEVIKGYGCKYLGDLLSKRRIFHRSSTDLLFIPLTRCTYAEKKLINSMLKKDPTKRISMNSVFQHVKSWHTCTSCD